MNTVISPLRLIVAGLTTLVTTIATASSGMAPGALDVPTSPNTSRNWSGYAATSGHYTSVTGTWVVPTVSPAHPGADTTWVGIGGVTSGDLIQAGTQNVVSRRGGIESTAFYELLPDRSRSIPVEVAAGDSITVTITETSKDKWNISLTNNTTKRNAAVALDYVSTHSSAEWIEEAPSSRVSTLPLDDFGAVHITSASSNEGSVKDSQAQGITMMGEEQVLASPSDFDADGKGFTVTRSVATSTSSSAPMGSGAQELRYGWRYHYGYGY